ncbi:MAG: nitrogen fixation protein [Acidobacteria bacterium]|nr:nitrogen fixation protein [Acidobacteriota bacterium]
MNPEDRGGCAGGRPALLCPSAQPEMSGSMILGVMGGTAEEPRLSYLEEPQPVTGDLLALAAPVQPTQIFRFAAQCEESACCHFDGSRCRLATRIVQILPAVVAALPPCRIRPTCRWYQQEGRDACLRCPQIETQTYTASEPMILAATPA